MTSGETRREGLSKVLSTTRITHCASPKMSNKDDISLLRYRLFCLPLAKENKERGLSNDKRKMALLPNSLKTDFKTT